MSPSAVPPPLIVALGAAVGGAFRQVALTISIPTKPRPGPSIRKSLLASHWRVAMINVAGSAILVRAQRARPPLRRQSALLVGAGFCGGFTTFSTFAVEAARLSRERGARYAGAYVVVANVAALIAVAISGGY